jgi:endonuclease/exonuclease/phosphatase family metal-dependent hydrolase
MRLSGRSDIRFSDGMPNTTAALPFLLPKKASVKLHIATYNIHKGFSQFNRRMMIRELRERLQLIAADIIFLQEVQGEHHHHASSFEDWPEEPQYEFLADQVWNDYAYGRNAVYDYGHHGNAILSRYPIVRAENQDVSHHAFERRGLLHCEIELPGKEHRLHCICVHLALNERGRRHQVGALIERLQREVPDRAPLVVAGDFNDWRNLAGKRLAEELGLREALLSERLSRAAPGPHLHARLPRAPHARASRGDMVAPLGPRGAVRAPAARMSVRPWRTGSCPATD